MLKALGYSRVLIGKLVEALEPVGPGKLFMCVCVVRGKLGGGNREADAAMYAVKKAKQSA